MQIVILQSEVEKTKMEATKASDNCDRVMADIEECKNIIAIHPYATSFI